MAAGDLIAGDGNVEWQSLLLGELPYRVRTIDGWDDLPEVSNGNVGRSAGHGSYPGRWYAAERIVTVAGDLMDQADLGARILALSNATEIQVEPVESPLVIRRKGRTLQAFGRVLRRAIPATIDDAWGGSAFTVQWICSDPRRYGLTLYSASTGPTTPGTGGLTYPLAYPLDYGSAGASGSLTLSNAGSTESWPTFVITGPCTGPIINYPDLGRALAFASTFTVAAGQTLTIDTLARSVLLNGSSRRDQMTSAQWTSIPAGTGAQRIAFTSIGSTGTLSAAWRDAWF